MSTLAGRRRCAAGGKTLFVTMPNSRSNQGDFHQRVSAMDALLASTTTIDRTVLDRALATLSGLNLSAMDPKLRRKLERILVTYNEVAIQFPDVSDPSKPLPATALVAYAYRLQQIRMLAAETGR